MREFLKGLELDNETIDTIMAEVGKRHQGLKEEIEKLESQNKEYQTNINELNSKIAESEESLKTLEQTTNENRELKTQMSLKDSNVKSEFMKFVGSEIMSKVDDTHDFASVLGDYKKENPQFFGDTVVKKVQSSPVLAGGNPEPQSTNNIMNDILRATK